jgi:hypothetical protein
VASVSALTEEQLEAYDRKARRAAERLQRHVNVKPDDLLWLIAEVQGGRIAFGEVVEKSKEVLDALKVAQARVEDFHRDKAFLHAVVAQGNAESATLAAIIAWLRGPVALRVGEGDANWLANRCAARDWRPVAPKPQKGT